jgi:hypothetical protein
MYNYQQIDALFGAPLNTVPTPRVPYKLKTWHVVGGVIVLGVLAYGAYALHRDFILKEGPKFKFKDEE